MNEGLAIAAAVSAWFGAVVMVLSDARRGMAVGLLIAAAGLAAERAVAGQPLIAVILLAGGLLGAVAGLPRNPVRGWGILGPGSTPRVVLCIVVGASALYLGRAVLEHPADWQARAAILAVGALGAARLLSAGDQRAVLTAASVLALVLALTDALLNPVGAVVAMIAGALLAGVLGNLPTFAESAQDA